MAKTSFGQKLKALFGIHKNSDSDFFEELTDALIEGDVGARTAVEIVDSLEKNAAKEKFQAKTQLLLNLKKYFWNLSMHKNFLPSKEK